jgi:hypothetical protein
LFVFCLFFFFLSYPLSSFPSFSFFVSAFGPLWMSHQIRFDPDDAAPLTYCQQVSPKRFEQQGKDESGQAVRQLLEHIIDDKNMSLKDKRKRLKQVTCGLNSKFVRFKPDDAIVCSFGALTRTFTTADSRRRNWKPASPNWKSGLASSPCSHASAACDSERFRRAV